jgi:hypothetical protein
VDCSIHSPHLYAINKHRVTADDPRVFLETKSSQGEMHLFGGLTCHTTHERWHPTRIQQVYSYLYIRQIIQVCMDVSGSSNWHEGYSPLPSKANSDSQSPSCYPPCALSTNCWGDLFFFFIIGGVGLSP